jgi:hypothetical protein
VLKLPAHPLAVTILNFGRDEAMEEIDLGEAGKDSAGQWVDILTGSPADAPRRGRVVVRLPALTGTTLVLMKGR